MTYFHWYDGRFFCQSKSLILNNLCDFDQCGWVRHHVSECTLLMCCPIECPEKMGVNLVAKPVLSYKQRALSKMVQSRIKGKCISNAETHDFSINPTKCDDDPLFRFYLFLSCNIFFFNKPYIHTYLSPIGVAFLCENCLCNIKRLQRPIRSVHVKKKLIWKKDKFFDFFLLFATF